jgi:hypothetical protein
VEGVNVEKQVQIISDAIYLGNLDIIRLVIVQERNDKYPLLGQIYIQDGVRFLAGGETTQMRGFLNKEELKRFLSLWTPLGLWNKWTSFLSRVDLPHLYLGSKRYGYLRGLFIANIVPTALVGEHFL